VIFWPIHFIGKVVKHFTVKGLAVLSKFARPALGVAIAANVAQHLIFVRLKRNGRIVKDVLQVFDELALFSEQRREGAFSVHDYNLMVSPPLVNLFDWPLKGRFLHFHDKVIRFPKRKVLTISPCFRRAFEAVPMGVDWQIFASNLVIGFFHEKRLKLCPAIVKRQLATLQSRRKTYADH
jgi:hypothetical protein